MQNRTRLRFLDEPRDVLQLRADLEGERRGVVWALKQLAQDIEEHRAPRRKEPRRRLQ